ESLHRAFSAVQAPLVVRYPSHWFTASIGALPASFPVEAVTNPESRAAASAWDFTTFASPRPRPDGTVPVRLDQITPRSGSGVVVTNDSTRSPSSTAKLRSRRMSGLFQNTLTHSSYAGPPENPLGSSSRTWTSASNTCRGSSSSYVASRRPAG